MNSDNITLHINNLNRKLYDIEAELTFTINEQKEHLEYIRKCIQSLNKDINNLKKLNENNEYQSILT